MSNNAKPTLIECPVCNGKVSSDAKSCPHCGHPLETRLNILSQAKERFGNAATSIKPNATSAANTLLKIVISTLRFCAWVVVSGLICKVGVFVSEMCLEGSYLACVFIILAFPAMITIPVIGLSKYLVGNWFSKALSYICALSCTITTPRIFESSFGTDNETANAILQIVGVFIAFLWSIYFVMQENQKKGERILKWLLIVFNLIIAITYSIIAVSR